MRESPQDYAVIALSCSMEQNTLRIVGVDQYGTKSLWIEFFNVTNFSLQF